MSDTPFYMTRMGRRFYEHTAPELVEQIARLNKMLDRIAAQLERADSDDADA